MSDAVTCMWMRGGTSKGGFFLAEDLPTDMAQRDRFLLRIMGSPDPRQIDGMGGADPLTAKVAVVSKSDKPDVDVEYLFLQVYVDEALVSDAQNCGNMLAGVGPFAIERGLVEAQDGETPVRVFMVNTGQVAVEQVQTPGGEVTYEGDAAIDGVPGTAAPVLITFKDTAGSSCGALLPTGNTYDTIDGCRVTCIDNGMPTVLLRARDFDITGTETREALDNNAALKTRLEKIRLQAGYLMNLGDVTEKTVPKMTLVSPPQHGGVLNTRTFIPHRCHASIGVLGAVSVATAAALDGSIANEVANIQGDSMDIEHPIGKTTVVLSRNDNGDIESAAILRTARKLMDGVVFD
ncbi:4-oxalomesaconate tautomerase [Saccharospirillum salsuginis]|uniref:FldA protein n=1 Tax=Saccharospirillum salsuginis TaxID=418750 RepID=A0A918KM56_9GAMM|nr:4-oxalomesaconate tautomerase [Saccharospirillum salsuginis]GGX69110.1 FldA protein [Saccharospirillum salsuginis]